MMFKKGSFEIGATIYPVAMKVIHSSMSVKLHSSFREVGPQDFTCTELACIFFNFSKYDPKFGDAFWNSSKYSMVNYLLRMMTSWALVCNVWYLPAMHQKVCITCALSI